MRDFHACDGRTGRARKLLLPTRSSGSGFRSSMPDESSDDAEEHEEEEDDEGDETVAGDAFFVAHGAEALDAAGGEIADQFGIGGGGAAKMVFQAAEQRGEIIFADA